MIFHLFKRQFRGMLFAAKGPSGIWRQPANPVRSLFIRTGTRRARLRAGLRACDNVNVMTTA